MTVSKLKTKIQLSVCTILIICLYGETAYGNVLPAEIQSHSKLLFNTDDNNNTYSRVNLKVLNNETTTEKPAEE